MVLLALGKTAPLARGLLLCLKTSDIRREGR
jgi:hypothetical protein